MHPGNTRVMEPILEDTVNNKEGFIYQVKWDGVRMLTFVAEGRVVLQNRKGRIKTSSFPELNCLGNMPSQPLVLDGEIVSLKDGKPNFNQILKRNFASHPGPHAPPIFYVVFDILSLAGKDLRNLPLTQRQDLLSQLKLPGGPISIIDNFIDGEELLALTQQREWEGIVAKAENSPYVPGKSSYWQKIKNKKKDEFPIVGYVCRQGQLASLLVGKDFGQGLTLAGAVGSGLGNKQRKGLQQVLEQISVPQPQVNVQKQQQNWYWVRPLIEAEVEFMEWTDSLTLRAPVLKKISLEGRQFELS